MSLQEILLTAEKPDFEFMIDHLTSPFNVSADAELHVSLTQFSKTGSERDKRKLVELLEKEIRYVGSADIAYFFRWMTNKEPGVTIDEIINDICSKLGIAVKKMGPVQPKLEKLVQAMVEKQFQQMTPEEQRQQLQLLGVSPDAAEEVISEIKKLGQVAIFSAIILPILGKELAAKLITSMTLNMITAFVGREAAAQTLKQLAVRFPWWAEVTGPFIWGITTGWLVVDLQGPAFRKTCPVILYLALINLRNGPEDDSGLWEESE